jgi:hypothetical protein
MNFSFYFDALFHLIDCANEKLTQLIILCHEFAAKSN